MSISLHVGKRQMGIYRNGKITIIKHITKKSKDRFFNLFHSGNYDTHKTGLIFTVFR